MLTDLGLEKFGLNQFEQENRDLSPRLLQAWRLYLQLVGVEDWQTRDLSPKNIRVFLP